LSTGQLHATGQQLPFLSGDAWVLHHTHMTLCRSKEIDLDIAAATTLTLL